MLIIGSYYGYQWYPFLPASASIGISYLIYMLAIIVAALGIRFSRSTVFFYALLVLVTNLTLRFDLAEGNLNNSLVSSVLPMLLVVLTLLPERGIINIRAIPAHLLLIASAAFVVIVAKMSPPWATHLLLSDWAPARYFDWTNQSQSVLIVTGIALYIMLTLATMKRSLYLSTGFGVLLMLAAQLHFGDAEFSLNVFSGIALLMCLYAIMQETWRMAYVDDLTGLQGRRALSEKLQRIGGTYTIAMLDVDHFKKFNDNYGHDTGDAVLRMIATQMAKVEGGGAPYRYGGEEFAIVFNGKKKDEATRHLDNLRVEIAGKPFVIRHKARRRNDKAGKGKDNKTVKITVSIGFADSSDKPASPWDVVKLADQALYRAKGKGRNCIST
ncbi:MAG: GGDEF domain-containing protein [Pseudomonadota bacterium]